MPGRLTRDQLKRVLHAAWVDPKPLLEQTLHIRDINAAIVPFVFNESQLKVHELRQAARRKNQPVRQVQLKARKVGMSTQESGYDFIGACARPMHVSLIVGNEKKLSRDLNLQRHLFVKKFPEYLGLDAKATQDKVTIRGFECLDGYLEIGSEMNVETATGREVGRGSTPNEVHLSEFAFYPDPEKALAGVLNAVPFRPGTVVILESTANGMGTYFHELWKEAKKGRAEFGFTPVFIAWHALRENRVPAPVGFEPSKEELELLRLYRLDHEQLWWRRRKIVTDFRGDEEKFAVEHPASDVEAFQVSGRPALPRRELIALAERASETAYQDGDIRRQLFVPRRDGIFRVFERAVVGHEYMIGVDCAAGIPGRDYTAAAVLDRTTSAFVAEVLVYMDPRKFAGVLRRLGMFFNMAIVAIEINNHGLACQNELVHNLRYPHPHRWQIYDKAFAADTEKIGWATNYKTRELMIDDMVFGLREHLVTIPSERMIEQLLVVGSETDKPGDDDLADAVMIAWTCHFNSRMRNGRLPRGAEVAAAAASNENAPSMPALSRNSGREWDQVDRYLQQRSQRSGSEILDAVVSANRGLYYRDDDRDPFDVLG